MRLNKRLKEERYKAVLSQQKLAELNETLLKTLQQQLAS